MIHLLVARPAEARPLVERYGLREQPAGPFPLFRGDSMALAISGPGKTATAAAAGWLYLAAGGVADGAWLGVGMAGHAEMEIGSGVLAHKVVDAGSGECWYPPIVLEHPAPSTTVVTVDRLDQDYEGAPLYDTEAAGLFAAAGRFATAELVHAFRIVADNHGATLGDNFAEDVMADLVASKLDLLDGWIEELREMSELARRGGEAA
jgi:hypothetical protein